MMKVLVLCFMATLWMQLPPGGNAECCSKHKFSVRAADGIWHKGDICGDCSKGTPYCSYQGCNMFGCNCDGGCRRGLCDGPKFEHQMRSLPSEDARDVIRAADRDGDGRMSIEEAHAHVVRETNQMKRSLKAHAPLAKESNQEKRTMEAHAPIAKESNQEKRTMEAHAHLAKESNQEKRTMEAHAPLTKEALPANQEKRTLRGNAPHQHLKRSLEAMDVDKDNFLSAKEID